MSPGAGSFNVSTRSVPLPESLHVLTLPDFERVGAIQTYWTCWGNPKTRTLGEVLIDCIARTP